MVHILEEIETYAKIENVPIMEKEGIKFLTNFIKENKIKTILEIGSAIGYSSSKMALVSDDIKVTTIERDIKRYNKAVENINKLSLNNQINIYNEDALTFTTNDKFDLIFIDAAKSQYIKFFEKYSQNLNENGYIVSDNISFHGLVDGDYDTYSRNVKGLVRKLKNYITYLEENENYNTKFINIGDKIAITTLSITFENVPK